MMNKKKEFDKSILILIAIIVLTIITAISLYFSVRVDKVTQILKSKDVLKVLIVVEGEDGNPVISQVLFVHSETNKGALIDVSPDIGTIIPEKKQYARMDAIYKEYGIDFYRERISNLLNVDIPFSISITENNFSEIIDLLGGLDLFVSKSLESTDLGKLVPSGSVVLEGDKVLQYMDLVLIDEHNNSLVNRKQKIIQSFLTQIKWYSQRLSYNMNLNELTSRISTNMDYNSISKVISFLGGLQSDRLVLQGILGDKKYVGGEELIFPYNNEKLIKVKVRRIIINLGDAEVISDEKLNFNIEVLNGTDNRGLASRTAKYLSSFGGYTISNIGNSDRIDIVEQYTEIWDRKGNIEAAEKLGELINCTRINTGYQEGIDDTIDFTIILGKDFDGKRVKD